MYIFLMIIIVLSGVAAHKDETLRARTLLPTSKAVKASKKADWVTHDRVVAYAWTRFRDAEESFRSSSVLAEASKEKDSWLSGRTCSIRQGAGEGIYTCDDFVLAGETLKNGLKGCNDLMQKNKIHAEVQPRLDMITKQLSALSLYRFDHSNCADKLHAAGQKNQESIHEYIKGTLLAVVGGDKVFRDMGREDAPSLRLLADLLREWIEQCKQPLSAPQQYAVYLKACRVNRMYQWMYKFVTNNQVQHCPVLNLTTRLGALQQNIKDKTVRSVLDVQVNACSTLGVLCATFTQASLFFADNMHLPEGAEEILSDLESEELSILVSS